MEFAIIKEISPEVIERVKILDRVSDVLESQFLRIDFEIVKKVLVGVNCVNPKLSIGVNNLETGSVIYKKYTKSSKSLDLKIKLNYSEIVVASENDVLNIFAKGIQKSFSEIESLDIKGFDINRFYNLIKEILQDRSWLDAPYQERFFHYQQPQLSRGEFLKNEKMHLDAFWRLVETARINSRNNFHNQIEIIVIELSKMEEIEIFGFECTLRELIILANHYNVMAVQKIVEGNVNDDSFLYFRCKLILYGRITFENAIRNPNYLYERIDSLFNGEFLLSVADRAFSLKFGNNTDKILPRDYASKIIDYDFDSKIQGKDWEESDLPKRYSKLWKSYH